MKKLLSFLFALLLASGAGSPQNSQEMLSEEAGSSSWFSPAFISITSKMTAAAFAQKKKNVSPGLPSAADLKKAKGRPVAASATGAESASVKTVFVFSDSACGVSKSLIDSGVPQKFQKMGIRTIIIPVSILQGSTPEPGLYFLKHGVVKWRGERLDDNKLPSRAIIAANDEILYNYIAMAEIEYEKTYGSSKKYGVPFMVYPVAKGSKYSDYKVAVGVPRDEELKRIAAEVIPMSYVPYSGQ